MSIKETTILRSKEIDHYFENMKRLITQRDEINEEIKQNTKRLNACKREIKSLDNWIKTK